MITEQLKVTVISHTHWDRTWYVPFQEFRIRLVRLIDNLLEILERDPNYRCFMLDGQMIVIEDYLEVKPENRARIKKLVEEGRLHIGPWYVLADEFLVSSESLIRNLQLGHKLASELGEAQKVGYTPDAFGHIAQLPQILRGFCIDTTIFWRGFGEEAENLGNDFLWRALDESEVTAVFMRDSYSNAANLGYPLRWGDTSMMELDDAMALRQIKERVQSLAQSSKTGAILLMNGGDHAEPQPKLPEFLEMARSELKLDIRQGTLMEHFDLVKAASLPTYQGEFRWGKHAFILQGVYSSRMALKQRNTEVQNLLENYTEPLSAIVYTLNGKYPAGLIWTSWRWLLKNHPHDDICGCGVDQIHDEMMYRFDQSQQIGEVLVRDSFRALAQKVDWSAQEGYPLIVFNPCSWKRRDVVEGEINFSSQDKTSEDFHIVDELGEIVPLQIFEKEKREWFEVLKPNIKRVARIAFFCEIPSVGYRIFWIKPGGKDSQRESQIQLRENGAENPYLSFSINDNGTIDLRDKETGIEYQGLHLFEDTEDAGDEYTYSPCLNTHTVTSAGATARISLLHKGPIQCVYRVDFDFPIPEGLTKDHRERKANLVSLPITSYISIYSSKKGLFIRTELENRACDHRLRVHFPTPFKVPKCSADGHFAVLERSWQLQEGKDWAEKPSPTMHQREFVDISDGQCGLAVLNRGLPEYEMIPAEGGVAITLLRCVGWLSRGDLLTRKGNAGPPIEAPGGQCQGNHVFEYACIPHKKTWEEILQEARAYQRPFMLGRADEHEGLELENRALLNIMKYEPLDHQIKSPVAGGPLPSKNSFLNVEGEGVIMTALKKSERRSGLIVRIHNTASHPVEATLRFYKPLDCVYETNLNEERKKRLETEGNQVRFEVRANGLLTMEIMY